MNNEELLKRLNELFGGYKAEWLRGKIFNFFFFLSYFITLKDNRPCVLQGGRGSGKTTVLRGLSYQGQYALFKESIEEFDKNNFIGIYHRVNTNHVRAFVGGGLNNLEWQRLFGHYFNLIICREILIFVKWHKTLSSNDENFSSLFCGRIADSLHLQTCHEFEDLLQELETAMYKFQAIINNISSIKNQNLSMSGDPIKIVTECVLALSQFNNKIFYLLIDEYENLIDYQQKSINSLIKHNPDSYTFKIGVRELGWRTRETLNEQESLNDPADFVIVDIVNEFNRSNHFKIFAENVCQQRIEQILLDGNGMNYSIEKALMSMTMDEEAEKLGIKKSEYIDKIEHLNKEDRKTIDELSLLYQFFLVFWADNYSKKLTDIISDYKMNKLKWNTRYENYKYSMLFKIRKGRVGIRKYYSGWKTYIKLANGNIRYLMELVYRAYENHLKDNNEISNPVSAENQTIAAQDTGKKNLKELETQTKNGSMLVKLLLGLGRIFNVLICEGEKSAPEINQILLKGNIGQECEELLREAVMHLALIRIPGNKLNSENATRDFMYAIHPIYAPYFVFSHRQKRKMEITEKELLGIISDSKKNIDFILKKKNIYSDNIGELPEQLYLFEEFYLNDK
jgi:hypothetical protein